MNNITRLVMTSLRRQANELRLDDGPLRQHHATMLCWDDGRLSGALLHEKNGPWGFEAVGLMNEARFLRFQYQEKT